MPRRHPDSVDSSPLHSFNAKLRPFSVDQSTPAFGRWQALRLILLFPVDGKLAS